MANGPWYSQQTGDTTPLIVMPITCGFGFSKSYQANIVDANNNVTGPRSFVDWVPNSLRFTISATPGGPPVFSIEGDGAGEGATFQDAPNGIVRLLISETKTDLLQEQGLKIAYAWLSGIDPTGQRLPIFRAQANQTFATDEAAAPAA